MIQDPEPRRRAPGKRHWARLIQGRAARLRFGQALGGTLTLPDVSADERSAIDHFLGRRPSSGIPLVVRLAEMERILCESGMCDSLAEAVQAIAGPIEDQRRARDSAAHRWTDLFSSIEAAMADLPQYRDWLTRIRSTGLLKKYNGDDSVFAGMLLRQASLVLRQLPQPAVPLAELATRTTADSHPLNPRNPLPTPSFHP